MMGESICQIWVNNNNHISACDYPWMVKDSTGKWQGVIVVRVVPSTQDASVTGIVYDLAATGLEYAGIGFSQNGLMVF